MIWVAAEFIQTLQSRWASLALLLLLATDKQFFFSISSGIWRQTETGSNPSDSTRSRVLRNAF